MDSIRPQLDEERNELLDPDHLWLARGLTVLDQSNAALNHLRVAKEEGEIRHQVLRVDPFFENLRSDRHFREILAQMEARQEEFQRKVRAMNIDLYPPGTHPPSTNGQPAVDE